MYISTSYYRGLVQELRVFRPQNAPNSVPCNLAARHRPPRNSGPQHPRTVRELWSRVPWRLADIGNDMQLLRTVRAFLNNNHNKAREWLATSLPYLQSSLPPSSQLRSARVSSGQLYQPALPNPNVHVEPAAYSS